MRSIARLALAALALIAVAACAPSTITTATITPAAKAWPEFRMPGTDFAVSLPGEPELARDTTGKDGSTFRTYHIDDGTIVYLIAYSTSLPKATPPAPLDGWLDDVRDQLVAKMSGVLRSERRLAIGEARGMELVLDVPKSSDSDAYTLRGRFYVKRIGAGDEVRDILYQTLIVGDPGQDTDASVTRFLDSFHFVAG